MNIIKLITLEQRNSIKKTFKRLTKIQHKYHRNRQTVEINFLHLKRQYIIHVNIFFILFQYLAKKGVKFSAL